MFSFSVYSKSIRLSYSLQQMTMSYTYIVNIVFTKRTGVFGIVT